VTWSDWPVVARHTLPVSPLSPALARTLIRSALAGCPAEIVEVAELLVSELVTNSIVHAGTAPKLRIDTAQVGIRISVEDESTEAPTVTTKVADAEGGRGLLLVDALAQTWGWRPTEQGKQVWFTLGGG
jgi:anti-sigma regulatory factor (Ser/Thr protein kinase)